MPIHGYCALWGASSTHILLAVWWELILEIVVLGGGASEVVELLEGGTALRPWGLSGGSSS